MHNKSSPDAGRHVWGVFSNKEYRNVAASLPGLTCSSFSKGRAEQYENPDQVKDSAILVPLYLMTHYFPLHMALHPWSMMAESRGLSDFVYTVKLPIMQPGKSEC